MRRGMPESAVLPGAFLRGRHRPTLAVKSGEFVGCSTYKGTRRAGMPDSSTSWETIVVREPIPTWYFAVVVVRRGDRFLLVHERAHGQLWYLPAGRVEAGESFVGAAKRETLEETGVPIRIEGVLRIEHSPQPAFTRMRAVFLARPVDDTPAKSVPDDESLGAAWVSVDELAQYPLRGEEVCDLLHYVSSGGPVYPVSLLQREGMPYCGDGGRERSP
jgi:8-oxo-dGTP pyrophosphatase MutT (NUDIX family)